MWVCGIFCVWVCLLFLFLFLFYLDYIPGHKLLRKKHVCVFMGLMEVLGGCVCVCVCVCVCMLVTQSCLTLCDPMDCSPLGFSVCGILQTRILEQVAISFSRGSSSSRDQSHISCWQADSSPLSHLGSPLQK